MKLYYSPGACSMSPHIVLNEAGLSYATEKVDLKTGKTASGGDFKAINPKGQVPTLQLDDGSILTEGPAIIQYLADRAADKQLAPAFGSDARYRLIEWLNFITSELHKGYSPLFNPAIPDETKAIFRGNLERRLAWVGEQLGSKPYLMGSQFTVADAYLFTVLNWNQWVGIDTTQWPVLVEYQQRVAKRPAVHTTLIEEGFAKA